MQQIWSETGLGEHWSLGFEEHRAVQRCRTDSTKLGFAAQLRFCAIAGKFPYRRADIPFQALSYIGDQLGLAPSVLKDYGLQSELASRHRREILDLLELRRATKPDWLKLESFLVERLWGNEVNLGHLDSEMQAWFRQHHVLIPGPSLLSRCCERVRAAVDVKVISIIDGRLDAPLRERLRDLLQGSSEEESGWQMVKRDPGRVGLDSVLKELKKLERLQSIEVPSDLIDQIPKQLVSRLRDRAAIERGWEMQRHPERLGLSMAAAYCLGRKQEIIDSIVSFVLKIVHDIGARAERKVTRELVHDIERVEQKNRLLFKIAEAALANPDAKVSDVIFPIANQTTLGNLVKEAASTGPTYRVRVHKKLRASYSSRYRRMLPRLLKALDFRSNNVRHQPVLDAIRVIRANQKSRYFGLDEVVVEGVVRPKWRDIVIESGHEDGDRINCINYEICVLEALREGLRCREIWVDGASQFDNPDKDVPTDFDDRREHYYSQLNQPREADEFIKNLKGQMTQALDTFRDGLPKNKGVQIVAGRKPPILVRSLQAQPPPSNLEAIKAAISRRWSSVNLLDIVKEVDLRTHFTSAFRSAAHDERIDPGEVQRRLLLTIFGLGTNAGLKRVSAATSGVGYKSLLDTRRKYMTKEALRDAIRNVVNSTLEARMPAIWGDATTACAADSRQFSAWDQNLMTEWHQRYQGRGVMIYWHVDKGSCCIHSQLKKCSSSEVASMIQGVLRHCTKMKIDRQYVDSKGQSEVAFAFCRLLGFDLMPRLKAIGTQKLYLPDGADRGDYADLEPALAKSSINWRLIREQFDEMIKYATALREGTADPESLLRRFTRSNVKHPTYRALAELGRATKTLFLCRYLESESVRREIQEGLNVIENWNSANDHIFFGRGSEFSSNRLEDQEISALALHLVQNCLVYINTLMIQEVLRDPAWMARMTEEDFRGLTPLFYSHINPYGRFDLDMAVRLHLKGRAA